MKQQNLFAILLATVAFQAYAQPAYRSIDEQGNVTFSDAPVPGAVEESRIDIDAPRPSAAEVEESKRKATELLDAAGQAGATGGPDSGTMPDKAAQRAAAQRALKQAEQQLETAREVGPGDRIGTAGGSSRLKPQYLERVKKAEEEVERARKQLEATN